MMQQANVLLCIPTWLSVAVATLLGGGSSLVTNPLARVWLQQLCLQLCADLIVNQSPA